MVKINFKKILISIIAIFSIILSFGSYTKANDCSIVTPYNDGDFKSLDNWGYEHILPKTAMTQAMINLKSFCCDAKVFEKESKKEYCTQDSKIKQDGIYPSSAYLYDHILDVSMRRLDAKQENKNGLDLIYGLEPDPTGKAWRDFITKHANSKDGSIPLQISSKFKENREAGINSLTSWNPNSDKLWDHKKFENYDERKLIEKYKGICETSIYLYLNHPGDNKNRSRLTNAYQQCEDLSNQRIQKEFNYTKSVLMQKGNRLLFNNVKSYLDIYFSQNKLVSLQQLVFNIKNTFNEINKAVYELTPNCS